MCSVAFGSKPLWVEHCSVQGQLRPAGQVLHRLVLVSVFELDEDICDTSKFGTILYIRHNMAKPFNSTIVFRMVARLKRLRGLSVLGIQ